jgi:hypothetical protein
MLRYRREAIFLDPLIFRDSIMPPLTLWYGVTLTFLRWRVTFLAQLAD